LTRPRLARAATPEEIVAAAWFRPQRLVIEPEPSAAVARAYQASSSKDAVIIIGSLYLVGAVKQALEEGQLELANHLGPAPAEGLV
jgi:folylpolyglutamate synthase/dihydropteroate synthase